MKLNKSLMLCLLCLVAALVLMAWGFRTPREAAAEKPRYFALLTEDTGTDVMQFKQGAQVAAKEVGATVTFLTCAGDVPISGALHMLIASIDADANGIILPKGGEAVKGDALSLGIPVVCLFETDTLCVAADMRAMGGALAEAARAAGDVGEYSVYMDTSPAEGEMLEGLQAALKGENISINPDTPTGTVFALNANATLALADVPGVHLWGVDPGDARVKLLAEGRARGLIMSMPYAQGYQAVFALKGGLEARVPTRVVTRDTMYASENVKLMFPLLQ